MKMDICQLSDTKTKVRAEPFVITQDRLRVGFCREDEACHPGFRLSKEHSC